jgi:tetratricopeptide (TPR) repeat protein
MNSNWRILCSAQHFGYGPMAELVGLGTALRQYQEQKTTELLLLRNPYLTAIVEEEKDHFHLFDGRENALPLESFLENPVFREVDAVIASYDSASVFFGWFINCPVFLYDGLFWFWNFEKYQHCISEYLEFLYCIREQKDAQGLINFYQHLLEIDYHLTVLLAYHLCTFAYVRNGVGVSDRLSSHPELAEKIRVVGAVISPTKTHAPVNSQRSHILISLSGSLAPIIDFEQNLLFARGALKFALEAFDVFNLELPWYFCCHPKLYKILQEENDLKKLPKEFFVTPSFDYPKNLDMIRKAYALFISPGFSSIQEAAYFQTPVFFLPEQNGGQPAQLLMLKEAGYDTSHNWTVTEIINERKLTIGENDLLNLYKGVEKLWNQQMSEQRIAFLKHFEAVIKDERRRHSLIESQTTAVCKIFGNFDGAQQVAKHIIDRISY